MISLLQRCFFLQAIYPTPQSGQEIGEIEKLGQLLRLILNGRSSRSALPLGKFRSLVAKSLPTRPFGAGRVYGLKQKKAFMVPISWNINEHVLIGLKAGYQRHGYAGGVHGAEFSGLGSILRTDMRGAQFSSIGSIVLNHVYGAQLSGVANIAAEKARGAQFAGVTNIVHP